MFRLGIIGTENTHVLIQWRALRDKPYMAGQFLWAGIDYFGEAGWPKIFSSQGVIFRSGEFKARSYQRQSFWAPEPVITVARRENHGNDITHVVNWDPVAASDSASVEIYTNCEEAELFLNGKSFGIKPNNEDASPIAWNIPYEPGTIRAEGRNGGKTAATFEMRSSGKPHGLVVTTDRSSLANDFEDATHVRVSIVDENGVVCPNDDILVNFKVEGNGKIIAVYNDDVNSHEAFQGDSYTSFFGKAYAIVRATGNKGSIKVTASAEGMEPVTTTIKIKK